MKNIIQQTGKFKSAVNAASIIFATFIALEISIAIPTLLKHPVFNLLSKYEPWHTAEAFKIVSSIFIGITLALFVATVYGSWRLFAKRCFIAWLGATLLMTMVVIFMLFSI